MTLQGVLSKSEKTLLLFRLTSAVAEMRMVQGMRVSEGEGKGEGQNGEVRGCVLYGERASDRGASIGVDRDRQG